MNAARQLLERGLGRPLANVSFAVMHRYVKSMQRGGIGMMHTARPFSYYRKVFYGGKSRAAVLKSLEGKRVIDVGCGYTPYADDSMFQACGKAGIDFYGIDPLIDEDISFGLKERILARATGGSGRFSSRAPGLERALAGSAQALPFDDQSVDEILCSYLLFVWIEDEQILAEILSEFQRVLKPGACAKLYPLYEWRFTRFRNPLLKQLLSGFQVSQTFVHGHGDWRVTPSMLTTFTKL